MHAIYNFFDPQLLACAACNEQKALAWSLRACHHLMMMLMLMRLFPKALNTLACLELSHL
jgi:hypothetical protein